MRSFAFLPFFSLLVSPLIKNSYYYMFVEIHKWTDFDKIFYFIFLREVSVLNPLRDTVKYSALISEKYFKGEKNEKTHSS